MPMSWWATVDEPMNNLTLPERIRGLLRNGPLDDDELAARLGVIRQQVNEAGRAMERQGLVTRTVGPGGKIVTALSPVASGEPPPIVLASNRTTASGHVYADRTGISYEYPTRYRSLIVPGLGSSTTAVAKPARRRATSVQGSSGPSAPAAQTSRASSATFSTFDPSIAWSHSRMLLATIWSAAASGAATTRWE